MYIYILNKHGKPLMPTTRQSHIRKLTKSGLAVVVNGNPFTVRLKYETDDITQNVYHGIDTGRENIGEGSSLEDGSCVFLCHTETKNSSIKAKMDERRMYRQERRRHRRQRRQRKAMAAGNTLQHGTDDILRHKKSCKSISVSYPGMEEFITSKVIHGKEAKFNNRKREHGWLTPSGSQLIQMHMLSLQKSMEILPISHVIIENVSFDFQKLENEDIDDWQHGPLFGFKSYKDCILYEQFGRCLICGNPQIDEYHHIVPRSQGGSNTVKNIAGLCVSCHDDVHRIKSYQEELVRLKEGAKQEYKVSLLNSVMPKLLETMFDFCQKHGIEFTVTNGYETYRTREGYSLPKDHSVDGYAISLCGRDVSNTNLDIKEFKRRRFKKKSNNLIHTLGQREYYYHGKRVAVNRRKSECQMSDSLEEYISKYRDTHSEYETHKHMCDLEVMSAKRTYTCHKTSIIAPIHPGDVVKYEKHNKIQGNTKVQIFVAESVKLSDGHVYHNGTKSKKLKFCKRIQSGCLQYKNSEN